MTTKYDEVMVNILIRKEMKITEYWDELIEQEKEDDLTIKCSKQIGMSGKNQNE